MNRHTDEAFDFTGMSDVDYTDTFADIDQAEEERMEFIHGLRHVLSFCRNSDYTMLEWSDPSLDRMFDAPGCVTGSRKDGYVVSLSDIGCEIGFNTYHDGVPVVVASLDLDLSRAPAGWPSAKWGFGGNNFWYLLNITSSTDGTMDGSPAYVPGEVFAHLKTERTGSPTPMASSPAEVTGDFTVELDPADGVRYGPGFLNGAPLKIGGDFTIRLAPHHRHLSNLLWDKDNGEAVPAFTDGKKRTAASIKVEVKHYCGDYQPSTRRGRPGIMIKGPLPEIIMPGMTVTDDDFVYRVKSMAPYDYVVKNVWSRVANEQKNGQYIN